MTAPGPRGLSRLRNFFEPIAIAALVRVVHLHQGSETLV
jgi:hypothetical protein